MRGLLLVAGLMIMAPAAQCAEVPELSQYFEEEISAAERELEACGEKCAVGDLEEKADEWELKRFLLRVRAKGSFGVHGVVKLDVVPETELVWIRD